MIVDFRSGQLVQDRRPQAEHRRCKPEDEERREEAGGKRDRDEDARPFRFGARLVGSFSTKLGDDALAARHDGGPRGVGEDNKPGELRATWDAMEL